MGGGRLYTVYDSIILFYNIFIFILMNNTIAQYFICPCHMQFVRTGESQIICVAFTIDIADNTALKISES
jgi:hypothetical protein